MNRIRGFSLLIFSALYFMTHFMQTYGLGNEFFRFYLKDILLLPLLLFVIELTKSFFNLNIAIGKKEIFLAFLYVTVVFELIIPKIDQTKKGDPVDVLCYLAGVLISIYLFKQSPLNSKNGCMEKIKL